MDDPQIIELAARYVTGSATADEIELLNTLLQDPRYAEIFRRVNSTWLEAGKVTPRPEFDAEWGLTRLTEKLKQHEPAFQWEPAPRHPARRLRAYVAYGVGAALAVVFLVAGIAMFKTNSAAPIAAIDWIEKSTRMGEKIIVALPDGSTITLNADSRMSYRSDFNNQSREVFLEGEGYFEIKHDESRPFIVHSGSVVTKDLGTSFNISSYPSDRTVRVSLVKGSIQVSARGDEDIKGGIVLSPLQQFTFNKQRGTSTIAAFDTSGIAGWRDGHYVFDDTPLSVVCTEMEREYGVKFDVADTAMAHRPIRADFRNQSVWTVAEILRKATGMSYTAVKDQNTLKKLIFAKRK